MRRSRTFILLLHVLAAPLLVHEACAQAPTYTWKARVTTPDPDASPKLLFAAVVDAFSTADVAHDRETQTLTITTHAIIEQAWLEDVAGQAGFTVSGFWRDGANVFVRRDDESKGTVTPGPGTTNAQGHEE